MGCCISSTKKNSQQQVPVIETVKEVLSETHIAIPPPPPPPLPSPPPVAEPEAHFPTKQKKLEKEVRKEEEIRTPEVSLSQASEICSASETTISTATTISTTGREIVKGEEEVMSKRRSNLRSPGGKVNGRKKLNAPAERERAGRGQRPGAAASRTMASGGAAGGRVTRRGDGVGERSGRRSRSPVTRAAGGVGRGRGGGSPGQVTGKGGGRSVGIGGGSSTSSGSGGVKKEERNDSVLTERQEWEEKEEGERGNSEALGDNPLVSLECFIFL